MKCSAKLEEALFFLDKLRESEGKYPEFGYYLSALASVTRSLGLVLQADLRSQYGEAFDKWWEQKKQAIPEGPFEMIRDFRNKSLKRGGGAKAVFEVGKAATWSGVYEIEAGPRLGPAKLTIDTEGGPLPELERCSNESDEEYLDRQVDEVLSKRISEILPELSSETTNLNFIGFKLTDDCEPADAQTVIREFSEHLSAMAQLIEEAAEVFVRSPS